MTNWKCSYNNCSVEKQSKMSIRRHFYSEHSGELETPEEYLNRVESEQRDFSGEVPDTTEHDPEYETTNELPETRKSTLFEHEREEDSTLQDHTENGEDTE